MPTVLGHEFGGRDQVNAGVLAEFGGRLLVAVLGAENDRPGGPGIIRRARCGWLREQLEIDQAAAAVAKRGADAVGAGVAAADHDHVLVFRRDVSAVGEIGVEQAAGVPSQKIHREMHAFEIAPGDRQIARNGGPGGQQHGVEFPGQAAHIDGTAAAVAHRRVDAEFHALLAHQVQAAIDDFHLVELHIGYAVGQKAADAVGTLVNDSDVAGPIQLLRRGQPGGAGADHGDATPGARRRRLGNDPALLKPPIGDGHLDILDGYRRVGNSQHAGPFAGRRAYPAGEFGEIIGLVQAVQRFAPLVTVDQIVPLGNQIVNGAAVVRLAERHPAIHAACALPGKVRVVGSGIDLPEIAQALGGVAIRCGRARVLHEPRRLAHRACAQAAAAADLICSSTRL